MTAAVGMTMLEHVNLTFNFFVYIDIYIYTYLSTDFVHIQLDICCLCCRGNFLCNHLL